MNYRRITSRIQLLNPNEAYTFYCLAINSDYNTLESHIKQENLLEFINNSSTDNISERTLKRHLKKFNELGLIEVTTEQMTKTEPIDGKLVKFNRNSYKLISDNYILVDKGLSELKISGKLKGFLLILRTLCINGTSKVLYNLAQIAENTTVGKNSVSKYIDMAEKNNLLKRLKIGFEFTNKKIFIETKISDYQFVKNLYGEAFTEEEIFEIAQNLKK